MPSCSDYSRSHSLDACRNCWSLRTRAQVTSHVNCFNSFQGIFNCVHIYFYSPCTSVSKISLENLSFVAPTCVHVKPRQVRVDFFGIHLISRLYFLNNNQKKCNQYGRKQVFVKWLSWPISVPRVLIYKKTLTSETSGVFSMKADELCQSNFMSSYSTSVLQCSVLAQCMLWNGFRSHKCTDLSDSF